MKELQNAFLDVKPRVLDAAKGLVEYVASDQSLDSHREIILAKGWRFDQRFVSNPVFLDTHSIWDISTVLGKVVSWKVEGEQLIEVVQWAIDVQENAMAQLGFAMTEKGYLKAVSVGFLPTKYCYRGDDEFTEVVESIPNLSGEGRDQVRLIYQEQQQIELSACPIGANPNALAKAWKDGEIKEEMMAKVGFRQADDFAALELAGMIYEKTDDPQARRKADEHLLTCVQSRLSKTTGKTSQSSAASSSEERRTDEETRNRAQEERRAFLNDVLAKLQG